MQPFGPASDGNRGNTIQQSSVFTLSDMLSPTFTNKDGSGETATQQSPVFTLSDMFSPAFTNKGGNRGKAVQQCQYFKAGRCYKGKDCRRSHDPEVSNSVLFWHVFFVTDMAIGTNISHEWK